MDTAKLSILDNGDEAENDAKICSFGDEMLIKK